MYTAGILCQLYLVQKPDNSDSFKRVKNARLYPCSHAFRHFFNVFLHCVVMLGRPFVHPVCTIVHCLTKMIVCNLNPFHSSGPETFWLSIFSQSDAFESEMVDGEEPYPEFSSDFLEEVEGYCFFVFSTLRWWFFPGQRGIPSRIVLESSSDAVEDKSTCVLGSSSLSCPTKYSLVSFEKVTSEAPSVRFWY